MLSKLCLVFARLIGGKRVGREVIAFPCERFEETVFEKRGEIGHVGSTDGVDVFKNGGQNFLDALEVLFHQFLIEFAIFVHQFFILEDQVLESVDALVFAIWFEFGSDEERCEQRRLGFFGIVAADRNG